MRFKFSKMKRNMIPHYTKIQFVGTSAPYQYLLETPYSERPKVYFALAENARAEGAAAEFEKWAAEYLKLLTADDRPYEDINEALVGFLKRVSEGKATSDAEVTILPEVAKILLGY